MMSPHRLRLSTARSLAIGGAVAGAAIALGCLPTIQVRTQTAPGANIASRSTFRILATPAVHGLSLDAIDPMLDNSITNRSIREDIRAALEARGYVRNVDHPDVTIAYYATLQTKFELTSWDYGYTWRDWPREYAVTTPYEQGTVLIDVIDAKTNELLWRGRSAADVSTDPDAYQHELRKAVMAITKELPRSRGAGIP
jgi:hypothetical protein